jgi:translation initiation factor IF-1
MVINDKGGCKGKKVARKHLTKGKNELRLSHSSNEKYAIVKRLLGNTCDVVCDDGKERRCIIRGKFTGRNKRDNMLDSGAFILVGLREWVNEDMGGGGGGGGGGGSGSGCGNKNVKFCDLLEVYNSTERDILRRTHGVFDNFKDESVTGKYDDYSSASVAFIDQNTLKYQEMVKNMEGKDKGKNKKKESDGSGSGSGSGSDGEDETCNEQNVVITTSVKHIGKGVISQSYDISDSEGECEEEEVEEEVEVGKEGEKGEKYENKYTHHHHKKFEYTQENIVNIDDI